MFLKGEKKKADFDLYYNCPIIVCYLPSNKGKYYYYSNFHCCGYKYTGEMMQSDPFFSHTYSWALYTAEAVSEAAVGAVRGTYTENLTKLEHSARLWDTTLVP